MSFLGNTLCSLGDYVQAEKYYKECLSIYECNWRQKRNG
ncbi:MAG: tetratricopeptide repeat protein [Ignavibacteria bacterium]|nr:tetratricopeptide repeat protein [Ignavibacteria bacterium]